MAKEKRERELPDSIVLEDEYNRIRQTWLNAIDNAQAGYDKLLADKDIGTSLPAFEEISSDFISNFIDERISTVMDDGRYPHSARVEAAEEWEAVKNDLLQSVKPIEALRKIDKKAVIEVKDGLIQIKNMETLLRNRAKFVTPDSFKTFWNYLIRCADEINRLSYFQKTNGWRCPVQARGVLTLAYRPIDFINYCRNEMELKQDGDELQKAIMYNALGKYSDIQKRSKERAERIEAELQEKEAKGEYVERHRVTMAVHSPVNASGFERTEL